MTTLPAAEAGTLGFVLDRIMSGADVLVTAGDQEGRALLDAVEQRLAGSRQGAIRVSVPADGLSLSGLMAGITGRRDLSAHDDAVLELGFRALTATDETRDGTVLLVSGADGLQRPALRYIQFACRTAKGLHVVLAGTPGLSDVLAGDDLAALRTRLVALPAIVPARATVPVPAPAPPAARRVRRVSGWAAAGLGMAASLAVGLWIGRNGPQPPAAVPAAPQVAETSVQPATTAAVVTIQPAPAMDQDGTQVVVSPAIPAEAEPVAIPRVAENPELPDRAVASAPAPVADQAGTQEPALPVPPQVVPPPVRQTRAGPPRRWDMRTLEPAPVQAPRRMAPAQPRNTVVARPPSGPIRLDDGDDSPRLPRALQPEDTFGPMYSSLGRPRSFIGTYSANPDGTRTFRMEP